MKIYKDEYWAMTVHKLKAYIEDNNYSGIDPYDALMGWCNFTFFGHWLPAFMVQLHKRNPLDLRRLMGIKNAINPKAVGLLLRAYCLLYRKTNNQALLEKIHFLFSWLANNKSPGYDNACWGYPFDWANPVKYLHASTPTVVATSFVCKGIFDYYLLEKNPLALELLESSCNFILQNLPRIETPDGICFSYSPLKKDCCYNASILGAETLARLYAITKDDDIKKIIIKAVNFVLSSQHQDGHWNYSLDLTTGIERSQIDFHQGFILDSLHSCKELADERNEKITFALRRGSEFYYKFQFLPDGRSIWRHPRQWPVDIHNQAQGIISFATLAYLNPEYLTFAQKIASWTIENMQNHRGFFYYQKHRIYMNRIPYMRWSQAWMFLALATLLNASTEKE